MHIHSCLCPCASRLHYNWFCTVSVILNSQPYLSVTTFSQIQLSEQESPQLLRRTKLIPMLWFFFLSHFSQSPFKPSWWIIARAATPAPLPVCLARSYYCYTLWYIGVEAGSGFPTHPCHKRLSMWESLKCIHAHIVEEARATVMVVRDWYASVNSRRHFLSHWLRGCLSYITLQKATDENVTCEP